MDAKPWPAPARFCLVDLALGLVQATAFAQLFVPAAPGGDLSNGFTPCMFGTLLHPGVARIGTYRALLAMQQLVDLGDIGHVGRRPNDAVHQAILSIGLCVSLHAEEVLAAILRLVHLRITLVFPVLGRARRMGDRGVDDGALAQRQSALVQMAVYHRQGPCSQSVLLQQVAETHDRRVCRDAAPGQRQLRN